MDGAKVLKNNENLDFTFIIQKKKKKIMKCRMV
jgi:hypothetical protein